ncbi:ABC transporter permease [Alicyclobacillus fructus]|uniref:ABC transporter permease n=1 Tax=Alicyclobacillus fructus TaxID=2816082 RepID=UPI001A8BFB96|nr:ABC transporter permease [Alicyclobacillus fructus]
MKALLKRREYTLALFILLMLVVMLVVSPRFLEPNNLLNILLNSVTVGILALGQCLVIITKGIDLSVGANMGLVTLVVGMLLLKGESVWLSVVLGLFVGIVCGILNAMLISIIKLPPIIVTLGTMSVYSGLMYLVTGGQWVQNLPNSFLAIGNFKLFGIPAPVLVLLVLLFILTLFMEYTVVGRYVYAIGNNPSAARLAGVSVGRTVVIPYVLLGVSVK